MELGRVFKNGKADAGMYEKGGNFQGCAAGPSYGVVRIMPPGAVQYRQSAVPTM